MEPPASSWLLAYAAVAALPVGTFPQGPPRMLRFSVLSRCRFSRAPGYCCGPGSARIPRHRTRSLGLGNPLGKRPCCKAEL